MSGLTVGLLSIDQLELEIKAKVGNEDQKRKVSDQFDARRMTHNFLNFFI